MQIQPAETFQGRDADLAELKVYGRDPRDADPIFTKDVRHHLSDFQHIC
jgi:hypothetical protein